MDGLRAEFSEVVKQFFRFLRLQNCLTYESTYVIKQYCIVQRNDLLTSTLTGNGETNDKNASRTHVHTYLLTHSLMHI